MDSEDRATYWSAFHALSVAILRDDLDAVKQLAPPGSEVRTGMGNHWLLAFGQRRPDVIKYFASLYSEVRSCDVRYWVSRGDLECLLAVLHHADLSKPIHGGTCKHSLSLAFEIVWYAVYYDNLEILTRFLPHALDQIDQRFTQDFSQSIELPGKLQSTILHLASGHKSVQIIDNLIKAGADVHHVELDGSSVLHDAAQSGTAETFSFLLSFGLSIHSQDLSGLDPLHVALDHRNIPVVRLLLMEHGIHPPRDTAQKHSQALRQAFLDSDMELVYSFLEAGFSFNDRTFDNALDTFHRGEMKELLSLLRYPTSKVGEPSCAIVSAPGNALDLENITNWTRLWLSNCLATHGLCRLSMSEIPILPTRVLEIQDCGMYCRLVEKSNERAHYVTLSHRWQGSEMYRTTSKNVTLHYETIDVSKLSRPIQFAIRIVGALGIKYLWVGALCIIQDLSTDKRTEIHKMADIYSKSCVTIATIDQDIMFGKTDVNEMAMRPKGELDTRAWVLQEQVLSCRTLSYTKGNVYWDCLTCSASTSYPKGIPTHLDKRFEQRELRVLKEGIHLGRLFSVNQPVTSYIGISWHRIVEDYSSRYLTNQADKLIAMAGIISRLSKVTGDICLAGIWKHQVAKDLCWLYQGRQSTDNSKGKLIQRLTALSLPAANGTISTQQIFRAPSWSWLSSNFPVAFHSSTLR